MRQYSGQNHPPAGRDAPSDVLRHSDQRRGEDVGDDQVIGSALGYPLAAAPVPRHELDLAAQAVDTGDATREFDRARIDIHSQNPAVPGPAHGHGEDARAGSQIQRTPDAAALREIVDGDQTAARAFVRSRAEGGAAVHDQFDGAAWPGAVVVAGADEEPAHPDRFSRGPGEDRPIPVGDAPHARLHPDADRVEFAHGTRERGGVGFHGAEDFHAPQPMRPVRRVIAERVRRHGQDPVARPLKSASPAAQRAGEGLLDAGDRAFRDRRPNVPQVRAARHPASTKTWSGSDPRRRGRQAVSTKLSMILLVPALSKATRRRFPSTDSTWP